ncbi:hypothetical protein [Asanoa sp. NPDC050611]|uniref:hypothetical protein n=1 Tax=Asanoa sp. NPDC050611 TaxID=3157098 RepID=UPI0033C59293
MTKWIYRAVGTVGVAAGGALLLAGGAAQADEIDAPVNDLRGSLDGFFTPMGDHDLVGGTPDLAPGQHLGFLAAVPASPAAGVDPVALEAGPAQQQLNGDGLALLSLGDKQVTPSTVNDALSSTGPLVSDTGGGQLVKGSVQPSGSLPLLGKNPLGEDPLGPLGLGKQQPAEDQQAGDALSDDNLNTIGSDSQMRTLGSTVGVDQLGRGGGLGDLGRGPLGELTENPLGAVGKHAAPDRSDFDIADLKGSDLDGLGGSLVPPLIGEALEAEMGPGFLAGAGLAEADGDSMVGLPLVGQLPLSPLNTSGSGGPLGDLSAIDALGGSSGTAQQPAAQQPAQQPGPAPAQTGPTTAKDASAQPRGHRQWSRSSSERPVAGEDTEFH